MHWQIALIAEPEGSDTANKSQVLYPIMSQFHPIPTGST